MPMDTVDVSMALARPSGELAAAERAFQPTSKLEALSDPLIGPLARALARLTADAAVLAARVRADKDLQIAALVLEVGNNGVIVAADCD